MSLFKKKTKEKEKPKPEQQEDNDEPKSPMFIMRLVDGVHLDIAIEWPKDADIGPFAQVLALFNSGKLVAGQIAAVSAYALHADRPEQGVAIVEALEAVASAKKPKSPASEDQPLVPPSKFTYALIKANEH